MLTRADIPRLLLAGLKTEFQNSYNAVQTVFQEFTTEVKSTKAEEVYAWLGATPKLRKWRDERMPKAMREHGFTLKNEDYEASIEVHKNALDDDQYGQIKIRVSAMGTEAKKGYDIFAAECVEAGHTTVCYDGQNFFDTDHQEGKSETHSNYSSSGMALSAANIKTIVSTMRGYTNDEGTLAGINPTHIMVPTILQFTAVELFVNTVVNVTTDPAKAAIAGLLKVIVNPYLSNAGGANAAYYVLDLSQPVKPFIFQNRQNMEFAALDNPKDEEVFKRKKLLYGVDARFVF
jgi:phage major head subunit gpT-like protein